MSVSVDGHPVTSLTLTAPIHGLWTADITMDTIYDLPTPCRLDISDQIWIGTPTAVGESAGQSTTRLVGGRKLNTDIPPRFFRGLSVSKIFSDIMASAGTTGSCSVDGAKVFWVRPAGKASEALDALTNSVSGSEWRVLPDDSIVCFTPSWKAVSETPNLKRSVSYEHMREYWETAPTLLPDTSVEGYKIDSMTFISTAKESFTRIYYR